MASTVFKTICCFLVLAALPQALAAPGGAHVHQSRTDASFENDALTGHNSFRALHGASPLTWSDTLANAAKTWASGCKFDHSGGKVGNYGGTLSDGFCLFVEDTHVELAENLAAGSGDGFTITDAINLWTAEAKDYDPNNPTYSHFTQVVWKSTTELGCAVVTCPPGSIFEVSWGVSILSST